VEAVAKLGWFFHIIFATPLALGTFLVLTGFAYGWQRCAKSNANELRTNWRSVLPQFLSLPAALVMISILRFYDPADLLFALPVLIASLILGIRAIVRQPAIRSFAVGAAVLNTWLTLCMFAAGGELP